MRKCMIGLYFFVVFVISDFTDGQDSIKYKKLDNGSDKKLIDKVSKSPEREISVYTSISGDKYENQRDKGLNDKPKGRYRNTSPDQPIIGSFVNYGREALGEDGNNSPDTSKPENEGKDNLGSQKDQKPQNISEEQRQDSGSTQPQDQSQSDSQNIIPSSILNRIPDLQSMPQLLTQTQALTQTQTQSQTQTQTQPQPDQIQPIVAPTVPPSQPNNDQIPQVITTTVVYTVSTRTSPSQPNKTQEQNQDEQTTNASNYPQLSSSTKLHAHSTLKLLAPTNILQNSFALTSISILIAVALIIGIIPVPWPE
ncbi:hypothetical protein AYI69_g4998 [Smittium culicis]|uniref:Uncharacterized protein n=1 Tax=Smittium culicis TaxID=133412 RepID=A0A1R1Y966_9FUNG|nr:hypothetical protein AYI69_g4998 [Smittium culicis]